MIDLHCHILPGIDDGPATIEEALAQARLHVAAGTTDVVATPHVNWEYPTTAALVRERLDELQARLDDEGIALRLHAGGELAATRAVEFSADELRTHALGGGEWLLVELPFLPSVVGADALIATLRGRGNRVILAHPERCPAFHNDFELLERMVEQGVLCSITAGSIIGRFGSTVARVTDRMLRAGLVHNVASDAHDSVRRPPGIAPELERSGWAGLGDWASRQVPAAILGGEPIPQLPEFSHPPAPRRGGLLGRLRR